MASESCRICGGDGRIGNSFGLTTSCPGCHGSGRRSEEESGLRDVTKTKASHYQRPNKTQLIEKSKVPVTSGGVVLAAEVDASPSCSSEVKAKLIREIVEHEASHGRCTETFVKKIRKQVRTRP